MANDASGVLASLAEVFWCLPSAAERQCRRYCLLSWNGRELCGSAGPLSARLAGTLLVAVLEPVKLDGHAVLNRRADNMY